VLRVTGETVKMSSRPLVDKSACLTGLLTPFSAFAGLRRNMRREDTEGKRQVAGG